MPSPLRARARRSSAARWLAGAVAAAATVGAQQPLAQRSGVYPQLAVYNQENECGIGGVVPWAGGLWFVTYAPHAPRGSTDKLYRLGADLELTAHPASIGGTPANRMVHRESGQLFLGPYAIDAGGAVRVIPYDVMPGRPTGTARHLTAAADKVLYATMEEGFYEVSVSSLEVVERFADAQPGAEPRGRRAALPGYHGKGLYSGQGVYVYANNGERGRAAMQDPRLPSGVLAEWDGVSEAWTVVRRAQFTEVSGPGGIAGSDAPATDPIWSVGWDHRSLLLGVRRPVAEGGARWRFFRLPKSSHAYDGAHGWNTEWPRIREVGDGDLLMTMHGALWRFPRDFGAGRWSGVTPRSNYLKVVGDFCAWQGRVVFGCDDHARSEFLNKRRAKGAVAAGPSHSNLWFVERARLDHLGPPIGRGAVWVDEDVPARQASDPFLLEGFDLRGVHLRHRGDGPLTVRLQVGAFDDDGASWRALREVTVPARGYRFVEVGAEVREPWIRVQPKEDAREMTAAFGYRRADARSERPSAKFDGLAAAGAAATGGLLRARAGGLRTMSLLACDQGGAALGYYELDGALRLRRVDDPVVAQWTEEHAAIPAGVLEADRASIRFVDDRGRAWRLPRAADAIDRSMFGPRRVDREVVTERDLFHAHGTFFELPAPNAGGFAKVRPVATHGFELHDYCGYRGLLVMSGVATAAPEDNPHIVRSEDGRVAVWVGAVDDLWELGKPRGRGGPWLDTVTQASTPSEPYLMTGYDHKQLTLTADREVVITAELDVTGDGAWCAYARYAVSAGAPVRVEWPRALSAYWVRFVADTDCVASAQLVYR